MPATPTALAAFLRGIEPRADVLLRAHAGPHLDSPAVLARVRSEFEARAARLPLAEWPLRYWGLLLAAPELGRAGNGLPDHPLYGLAPTRRLALLLRLVVGLEPAGAAKVLGLSETAYRALWLDAEEKLDEAGIGPAVLMRWQDGFQQQVRAATGVRFDAAPPPPSPVAAPPGWRDRLAARLARRTTGRSRPRPLRAALVGLLLVLLAALAATFLWPPAPPATASGAVGLPAVSPLDLAPTVAPGGDLDSRLVADPDLDLLLSAEDAPWRIGVGLLSWWSAQRGDPLPPLGPAAGPAVAQSFASLPPGLRADLSSVEAAWDALGPEEQAALRRRAEAWAAAPPARRDALATAYAAWLAQPARERSALRARHAEGGALESGEQAALARLADDWRALSPADRDALSAAFATLPSTAREDWGLGPRLGGQLPELRPLLAFVPADRQVALIDALAGLGDAERAALAERVAAMGTAERAALRARVLAADPTERASLLRAAAAP